MFCSFSICCLLVIAFCDDACSISATLKNQRKIKLEKLAKQHLSFSSDFKEILMISESEDMPQRWKLTTKNQSLCIKMEGDKFVLQYASDFDQASQQFDIGDSSRIIFSDKTLSGAGILIPAEGEIPILAKVAYDLKHSTLALKYEPGPFPLHVYVAEGSFELKTTTLKKQG